MTPIQTEWTERIMQSIEKLVAQGTQLTIFQWGFDFIGEGDKARIYGYESVCALGALVVSEQIHCYPFSDEIANAVNLRYGVSEDFVMGISGGFGEPSSWDGEGMSADYKSGLEVGSAVYLICKERGYKFV